MAERRRLGTSIFVTTRCNHQCGHCIMTCGPGSGQDMSAKLFEEIVTRCGEIGLLGYVVLAGGEPFLEGVAILEKIRFLLKGHGVLRILIPTNGRWVLEEDHDRIVGELSSLGRVVPFGLSVRLSVNEWNLVQFKERREELLVRWNNLESRHPTMFQRKDLPNSKVISMGRAENFQSKVPVTVHCAYDEWRMGELGYSTDYLSFWPDGSCRVCQSGGAVLGTYLDDYRLMLDKRAHFLTYLRRKNPKDGPGISSEVCGRCAKLFEDWAIHAG